MEHTAAEKVQELTARLNQYRNEYYNKGVPSVSDEVYDRLFDELARLEKEAGVVMSNSPTQTVGYPVVDGLTKTKHDPPLLSLAKQKDPEEILRFMNGKPTVFMLKLDGLTIKLIYEDGQLVEASTRGDGNEGSIVTHNAVAIDGIPMRIPFLGRLVVAGEAFIRPSDFERMKESIVDDEGKPPKNGRNLAAGSIQLYDAEIATLETLCAAFGISLCQFFAEGTSISLTDEQQALLERWGMLTAGQKKVLLDLMEQMV